MSKTLTLPFSPVALAGGLAGLLAVAYIALIAIVMSYAAMTVQFAQAVKENEAAVAALEAAYLGKVAEYTNLNYAAMGYARPASQVFVPRAEVTALR